MREWIEPSPIQLQRVSWTRSACLYLLADGILYFYTVRQTTGYFTIYELKTIKNIIDQLQSTLSMRGIFPREKLEIHFVLSAKKTKLGIFFWKNRSIGQRNWIWPSMTSIFFAFWQCVFCKLFVGWKRVLKNYWNWGGKTHLYFNQAWLNLCK